GLHDCRERGGRYRAGDEHREPGDGFVGDGGPGREQQHGDGGHEHREHRRPGGEQERARERGGGRAHHLHHRRDQYGFDGGAGGGCQGYAAGGGDAGQCEYRSQRQRPGGVRGDGLPGGRHGGGRSGDHHGGGHGEPGRRRRVDQPGDGLQRFAAGRPGHDERRG